MANLAGFDVIFEVDKDTVVDAVNMFSVQNPSGDGGIIYLLGGPFSVELPVVVPQVGATTLSLILEITLEPVVHQSVVRLLVTLRSGSCTLLGKGIDHIGGSLTLDVPLVFQLAAYQSVDDPWQIVLQTPAAHATCQFDAVTEAKVGAVLDRYNAAVEGGYRIAGERLPANVSKFCDGLIQAIRRFVGPIIPLPVPLLRVLPGVDSSDPLQLSAVPIVAWIDSFTLGVFGYYSASGSGGSVSAKTESDLDRAHEEFLYLPEPEGVTRTRQVAFLLAADPAHRLLLCPYVICDSVIQTLRFEQETNWWVRHITATRYQAILAEENLKHLLTYFVEEMAKGGLDAVDMWLADDASRDREKAHRAMERAEARVIVDVLNKIKLLASDEAKAWLADELRSRPAIAAAVPPPCGTGTVEAFRRPIDEFSVQSDFVVGNLLKFDIVPDDGHLVAHYKVEAFIEEVFGDVILGALGDIEITLDVAWNGWVMAHVKALPAEPYIDASGLTGTLLGILQGLFPGGWSAMLVFLGFVLQQKLQSTLENSFSYPEIDPQTGKTDPRAGLHMPVAGTAVQEVLDLKTPQSAQMPQFVHMPKLVPLAGRAKDIHIAKGSIALIELVARHFNHNDFNPRLELTVETSLTASAQPPIKGSLYYPETVWGCPDVTFTTTRALWDTEIRVKARPRDLNMPLTIGRWTIEIGNFTVNSIELSGAEYLFADPRPRWSGAPAPIKSGALRLSGIINHPDPPLTNIDGGPFPLGHLRSNTIEATVAGSDDTGWSIRFRGNDGNFFVRVMLEATDGDKLPRHGETLVVIKGDELQLPQEYADYKASCDAKYKAYRQLQQAAAPPVVERMPVLPGQAISLLQHEAEEISRLVQVGDPEAIVRVQAIRQHYGPDALRVLPLLARGSSAMKGGVPSLPKR